MRSALSAVAVAASVGILCAQVPERALQQIRPESIRAHMQFLADDLLEGRGTATRGHQLAASYVAAQFIALGMDPAFGQSFFQPVSLRHAEAIGTEILADLQSWAPTAATRLRCGFRHTRRHSSGVGVDYRAGRLRWGRNRCP